MAQYGMQTCSNWLSIQEAAVMVQITLAAGKAEETPACRNKQAAVKHQQHTKTTTYAIILSSVAIITKR